MEQNKRFEVFGTLTKTETVFAIDHNLDRQENTFRKRIEHPQMQD